MTLTGDLRDDGLGQERLHHTHRVQVLPAVAEEGRGHGHGRGLRGLRQDGQGRVKADTVGGISGEGSFYEQLKLLLIFIFQI